MKSLLIYTLTFISFCSFGQSDNVKIHSLFEDEIIEPKEKISTPTGESSASVTSERLIHWVHGLSGDKESWSLPAAAVTHGQITPGSFLFDARRAEYAKHEYSERNLNTAMGDLRNEIMNANQSYSGSKYSMDNFVIAHSQGGIISRAICRSNIQMPEPRLFGGIVTFGTAHQGAKILNNIDKNGSNMLEPFLQQMCNNLGRAELLLKSGGGLFSSLLWNFVLFDLVQNNSSMACNILSASTMKLFMEDFQAGVTNGYSAGAPEINDLNANYLINEQNISKVAFYGLEDRQDGFWRLIQSEILLRSSENDEAFKWGDNDDDQLSKDMGDIASHYFIRSIVYDNLSSRYWIQVKFTIRGKETKHWFLSKKRSKQISMAYDAGYKWIQHANNSFEYISGERERERLNIPPMFLCLYLIQPYRNSPPKLEYYYTKPGEPCIPQPFQIWHKSIPLNFYRIKHHRGDVVVLAESAMNFPGTSTNQRVRVPFTNHQKLKNSQRTGLELINLLDGEYSLYFLTQTR